MTRQSERLRAAKVLAVEHHTTGVYARNDEGEHVLIDDPSAVSFCAVGAAYRMRAHTTYLIRAARGYFETENLSDINDNLGVEAVRALFDEAIRLAEQDEKGGVA